MCSVCYQSLASEDRAARRIMYPDWLWMPVGGGDEAYTASVVRGRRREEEAALVSLVSRLARGIGLTFNLQNRPLRLSIL